MIELKLVSVGNSIGVVPPKEALHRLKVAKGAPICMTDSPDGYRLTPHGPAFEQRMAVARKVMKQRSAA